MIEEIARHRCRGDDGSFLIVIECRYLRTVNWRGAPRVLKGAITAELLGGEPVRIVDARSFEVVSTGEILQCEPPGSDWRKRPVARPGPPDPPM